jgi:hypothetical protein
LAPAGRSGFRDTFVCPAGTKPLSVVSSNYKADKYCMKYIILLLLSAFTQFADGQIFTHYVDTSNTDIKKAIIFYKDYLSEFRRDKEPDYSKYWSKRDVERYKTPDPIVNSISPGYSTYNYGAQKSVFYARAYPDYVHLKTLMTQLDSMNNITVFAITNHYIALHDNSGKIHFVSPMDINYNIYNVVKNQNITYHFPKSHTFNKSKSDSLVLQIRKFERDWGFEPIKFDYYFASTQDEIAAMRGLDYYYGMEDTYPSGISSPEDKTIYCNGLGENYFHEVLHLYLNPVYANSPVNHGLVYYLGGSVGYSFDQMINQMNAYLAKYPDTDLSEFQKLETKDRTLHIDYVVIGLICKIVDEKEGVSGLKRILMYKDMTDLFKQEFGLEKKDWNSFLRQNFRKYDTSKNER